MPKISKKAIIIVSLSVILIVCGILSYFCFPFIVFREAPESRIEVDKENGILSVSDNKIKILQLTDLHTNGKVEMPLMFSIMKSAIMKSEPDLIVITGDVFSSHCREKDVETLCDFLAKMGIPWAVVLGNHDDETPYSLEDLSKILENTDASLFKRGDLSDRYGNYYYYLRFPDGKTQQLIFMDTRSNGFTEESVTFYENAVLDSAKLDGTNTVQNLLFYHIPLQEMEDAVKAYENDSSIGSGKIGEAICPQGTSVGFFDKVLELGRTQAMIFGHDHYNNAIINYLGVDFCYGTKTGIAGGHNSKLGGNLITLTSDGEYTIERLLHWGKGEKHEIGN
ncbi:MAG: metallophosphoesterase [Clostridia bacterium]|nr:metallophosphoesterase [Clostridia bacterium]